MRSFCTTGSINPDLFYFIPRRLPWGVLDEQVARMLYFSIHAPRQSGKSSAAKEYVKHLNEKGRYKALYCSLDSARATGNDEDRAMRICVNALRLAIRNHYPEDQEIIKYCSEMANAPTFQREAFRDCLNFWCRQQTKPIVLFLDEIDGLDERPLAALLAQIRSGFEQDRPKFFPVSMGLIGMRYLKDYYLPKGDREGERRYSPFNILSKFIRIPDFTEDEVRALYLQHSIETGQKFEESAIAEAYRLTAGQPWLINALANQACFEDVTDRNQPITREVILRAKETLISQHTTHIDNLTERLKEARVRLVIDAIIAGEEHIKNRQEADVEYVRCLGLIKATANEIANPIYQEVIPRVLTQGIQDEINPSDRWYVEDDGSLNMTRLLQGFVQYYRQNAEMLLPNISYHESYPHLLLMAYLQRLINGGGNITREYALGRRRADLFIEWKKQKIIIELKVKQTMVPLKDSFEQIARYLDTAGGAEAHLIVFDREALLQQKSWQGRISDRTENYSGHQIHLWTL